MNNILLIEVFRKYNSHMNFVFKIAVFLFFSFFSFSFAMDIEENNLFSHVQKITNQWKELVKSKKETNFMKAGIYAKHELEDKWDFYDDYEDKLKIYVSGWFESTDKLIKNTVNSDKMMDNKISFTFLGNTYGYNTNIDNKNRTTYSMLEDSSKKIQNDFSQRNINPINYNQKFNYQMYSHTEQSFFSNIKNNQDYIKNIEYKNLIVCSVQYFLCYINKYLINLTIL